MISIDLGGEERREISLKESEKGGRKLFSSRKKIKGLSNCTGMRTRQSVSIENKII